MYGRFLYNMDIYDTNIEYIKNQNYDNSLLRYHVIIIIQIRIKSSGDDVIKMITSSSDDERAFLPKNWSQCHAN